MGSLAILYLVFVNSFESGDLLGIFFLLEIFYWVEILDENPYIPPLSPSNFLQIMDIANEHSMYHPSHSMAITGTPGD